MFLPLTLALALAAGASGERTLLCRPRVAGDAAQARAEAVSLAGQRMSSRFLDYGVACEDAGEAARAARRAGLGHAVASLAEGRAEGTRYELVLADSATEAVRARRSLEVAPGADAVSRLRVELNALLQSLPPRPGPRPAHVAAWSVAGAGVVALAAGVVLAVQARDAADRAGAASDPAVYTRAREDWERKRGRSAVALGLGGAAVAAGLTWRFAF